MSVSIIVPVYNIKPYLLECTDSIAEQTFADFEVILVDDGSTDGSGDLCDAVCERDRRFTCIHQSNAGVSAARNAGIDVSKGDYIAFVDGDDVLHPCYLEKLIASLVDTGAEMCVCGTVRFVSSAAFQPMPDVLSTVLDGHQALINMLYADGLDDSPWGSVIDRSAWGSYRFPTGMEYEDLYLMPFIYSSLHRVTTIRDALYGYRQRRGSAMNTDRPTQKRLRDYGIAATHLQELPGYGLEADTTKAVDARSCLEFLRLRRCIRLSGGYREESKQLERVDKDCKRLIRGVLTDRSCPNRLKAKCLALLTAPGLTSRLGHLMRCLKK